MDIVKFCNKFYLILSEDVPFSFLITCSNNNAKVRKYKQDVLDLYTNS